MSVYAPIIIIALACFVYLLRTAIDLRKDSRKMKEDAEFEQYLKDVGYGALLVAYNIFLDTGAEDQIDSAYLMALLARAGLAEEAEDDAWVWTGPDVAEDY